MSTVVTFKDISKRYRLGAAHTSLRELLTALPAHLLRRRASDVREGEHIWALKNVSFDLEPGQVLGIIGRNGAGKTTLLKLLSRVVEPTSGRIEVNGRVSALIELGAGFHPDLTGRENIYLNGVILGMSRKEVDRKFDSIVAFAELERFIDTPVKRYSSGMYARLGFAVAAHSDPDLLLVDEVLAVGDIAFQQKCYDFIHSFVTGGNTAIFVSHSMYVVDQLCTRLIWLESGQPVMAGDPKEVLPNYLDSMEQRMAAGRAAIDGQDGQMVVSPVRFYDAQGVGRDTFSPGEDVIVGIPYRVTVPLVRPHFCLGVCPGEDPPLFIASMLADGNAPERIESAGELRCRFRSIPLLPRVYTVYGEVWGADRAQVVVPWHKLGAFRVADGTDRVGGEIGKGGIRHLRADAPIRVPYEWQFNSDRGKSDAQGERDRPGVQPSSVCVRGG